MKRKSEEQVVDILFKKVKDSYLFTDFYEKNTNWIDYPEINFTATLMSQFPKYFEGNNLNIQLLKDDIIEGNVKVKGKAPNKAPDLFKSLFKMPFKTLRRVATPDLMQIENEFGNSIVAHGVEEAKGGMYSLLMMCLCNKVRACSAFWGFFISGMPNISPVEHGPYYIIYKMPTINQTAKQPNNPSLNEVARILVPFQENKDILIGKLEMMVQLELIAIEQKEMFINKMVTYEGLLHELKTLAPSNRSSASTLVYSDNNNCFFDPKSNPLQLDNDEESDFVVGLERPSVE